MNTLLAASLFDSPWALLVIVLVGALSQWLMKRRQANQADNRADGGQPLPSLGKPQERSERQLDLQDALRQLLGGEPPPRAPQPSPVPPVMRDAQTAEVWSDEGQFQPEQTWVDEAQGVYEAARPQKIQAAPPSQPHPALARASAPGIEASDQHRRAARRFERVDEQADQAIHPAAMVGLGRARRSREGARAVALVREARTVRQAFIASLVFGSPKALET